MSLVSSVKVSSVYFPLSTDQLAPRQRCLRSWSLEVEAKSSLRALMVHDIKIFLRCHEADVVYNDHLSTPAAIPIQLGKVDDDGLAINPTYSMDTGLFMFEHAFKTGEDGACSYSALKRSGHYRPRRPPQKEWPPPSLIDGMWDYWRWICPLDVIFP